MYLRENSLFHLESIIQGYEMALLSHGAKGSRAQFNSDFSDFLEESRGWSTSSGWADAITTRSSGGDAALESFYEILEEFNEVNRADQR